MPANTIDAFISFSRSVLGAYQQNDPVAVRYRGLLEKICEAMLETHEIVLQRLAAVESALTPAETRAAVRALDADALRLAFHSEGMCDLLVGLGEGLSGLNYRVTTGQIQDDASHSLVPPQIDSTQSLVHALTNREAELAQEYVVSITELSELLAADPEDAGSIKSKADNARKKLIDQQAAFQHLAAVFARRPIATSPRGR
jgi:hypothetical protein